jgi:hypothetical protein
MARSQQMGSVVKDLAWSKTYSQSSAVNDDVNNVRRAVNIADTMGFEEVNEEKMEAATQMREELMTATEESRSSEPARCRSRDVLRQVSYVAQFSTGRRLTL